MQTSRSIIGLGFAFLLVLVCSCSSSSSGSGPGGGGGVGSCTIQSGKTCYDYPGSGFTTSSVQQACGNLPTGVYSANACASAGLVGSCAIMAGSSTEQTVRFYSSGFTASQAQTICTAESGTFTPG